MSTLAQVRLWGSTVGVVSMEAGQPAVFQYDSAFLASGVELAPLRMPLRAEPC